MSETDVAILATGALAAAACALPGAFLVLRGMSLLGDAISHAVLPGIVIAVLWTGEISSWPVVIGAAATGLVAVFLIESLHRSRRVKEDASIAVVFPVLFALGVVLIAQLADQVDVDQDCVLYGQIELAPLDRLAFGEWRVVRPVVVLGAVAFVNLLVIALLYKELQVATFDAGYALTAGLSPTIVHYGLMSSVSLTAVASFESVGAILVVAFLIVPGATARLLSDRLPVVLALSVVVGVGSSIAGFFFAKEFDVNFAGAMATAMGAAFGLAWALSPRSGWIAQLVRERRRTRRFAAALVLERLPAEGVTFDTLRADLAWTAAHLRELMRDLVAAGYVDVTADRYRATPAGASYARAVVV